MFQPLKQAIKHAIQLITKPQLRDDDDAIYYPARSMPEFPPGHPLSITPFPPGVRPFEYPAIKNHQITYPPTAPIQVISKIPDPIEPAQFSLPHPPARLSVPSEFSIKTCHVHSIPALLDYSLICIRIPLHVPSSIRSLHLLDIKLFFHPESSNDLQVFAASSLPLLKPK